MSKPETWVQTNAYPRQEEWKALLVQPNVDPGPLFTEAEVGRFDPITVVTETPVNGRMLVRWWRRVH